MGCQFLAHFHRNSSSMLRSLILRVPICTSEGRELLQEERVLLYNSTQHSNAIYNSSRTQTSGHPIPVGSNTPATMPTRFTHHFNSKGGQRKEGISYLQNTSSKKKFFKGRVIGKLANLDCFTKKRPTNFDIQQTNTLSLFWSLSFH